MLKIMLAVSLLVLLVASSIRHDTGHTVDEAGF